MISLFRPAAVMLAAFTLLTGLVYPLAMTGIIQVIVPDKANGSLVRNGETVIGSELIGQSFVRDGYFHSRPSAAGQNGYDAAASSGSNLGPISAKLNERIAAGIADLKKTDTAPIPADAVTASASGLDPHISIAYAVRQIARIARARNVEANRIQTVLDRIAERPLLGVFGEKRVNVLLLNLALDAEIGKATG